LASVHFTLLLSIVICVRILSVSYTLEKNQGSGGGVINSRDHAWTYTGFVHVISRLIGSISRLGSRLVD